MKKILYVLTIALGTCFAANAQSNQKSEESTASGANVEVKVAGQTVQSESSTTQSTGSTGAKACCSSKKSKNSAGAKACCTDGKKSDANCADKKGHADAGTKKDNE